MFCDVIFVVPSHVQCNSDIIPAIWQLKYSTHPLWYGNFRDHFVYVPSQWETMLHCNVGSHWLGACTKWSLHFLQKNSQYARLQTHDRHSSFVREMYWVCTERHCITSRWRWDFCDFDVWPNMYRVVRLPWILSGAPLMFSGAPRNIQGKLYRFALLCFVEHCVKSDRVITTITRLCTTIVWIHRYLCSIVLWLLSLLILSSVYIYI